MIKFSTLHLYDKKSNSTISRDKKKRRKDSIMSLLSAGGMHITDTKDVF